MRLKTDCKVLKKIQYLSKKGMWFGIEVMCTFIIVEEMQLELGEDTLSHTQP